MRNRDVRIFDQQLILEPPIAMRAQANSLKARVINRACLSAGSTSLESSLSDSASRKKRGRHVGTQTPDLPGSLVGRFSGDTHWPLFEVITEGFQEISIRSGIWFGTRRSEVKILSPRPIFSIAYAQVVVF